MRYDDRLSHKIGFIPHVMQGVIAGDLSNITHLLGLGGHSATYPCHLCTTTKDAMKEMPSELNRKYQIRNIENTKLMGAKPVIKTIEQQIRNNIKDTKKQSNLQQNKGCKTIPILDVCHGLFMNPTFHILQGIQGKLFKQIRAKLCSGSDDKWSKYNEKIAQLDDLEFEHNQAVDALVIVKQWKKMLKNQRKELDTGDEIEMDEADLDYDIDFSDEALVTLKKTTKITMQDIEKIKTEIANIEKKIDETGSKFKNFKEFCKKHKIEGWHYHNNSIIGRSGKALIQNIEELYQYIDPSEKNIFESMTKRLKFITNILWKKNHKPFTSDLLVILKETIINFDNDWHKWIHLYCTNIDGKYGNKWHMLYHCYAWCEYFKFSPAWLDDQRCESFNTKCKLFMMRYGRFHGNQKLC
jgi:hypothetical protein